jgi:hypothetical protein
VSPAVNAKGTVSPSAKPMIAFDSCSAWLLCLSECYDFRLAIVVRMQQGIWGMLTVDEAAVNVEVFVDSLDSRGLCSSSAVLTRSSRLLAKV